MRSKHKKCDVHTSEARTSGQGSAGRRQEMKGEPAVTRTLHWPALQQLGGSQCHQDQEGDVNRE